MSPIYIRVRDWVDRQWESVGNWRLLLLPTVALVVGALPFKRATNRGEVFALVVLWGAAIAWQLFVFWRWWCYMKQASRKAGQAYEAKGRYNLPEYADSEDAIMAAERRRKTTPPPR